MRIISYQQSPESFWSDYKFDQHQISYTVSVGNVWYKNAEQNTQADVLNQKTVLKTIVEIA